MKILLTVSVLIYSLLFFAVPWGSSSGRTADSDSANPGSNPGPPAKCTVSVVLSDADYSAISSKVPWVNPASCFGVKQKTALGVPAAAQIVPKSSK